MRKHWKIMALSVLIMSFLLSGCGGNLTASGTPKEDSAKAETYIALAKDKLANAKSFVGYFHAQMNMGEEGNETRTEAITSLIRQPLAAEIKIVNYYGEEKVTSDIYMEGMDQGANMYMAYDNQWTEMTLSEEGIQQSIGLYDACSSMELLLDAILVWDEVTLENGVVTMKGNIPEEQVYGVSEAGYFLQLAGITGIGEVYFTDAQPVPVEVKIKEDGTPLSYTTDFTATLQKVLDKVLVELNGTEDEAFPVKEYIITQEISQLGDLKKIEIPPEARSAINYEKKISLIEKNGDY